MPPMPAEIQLVKATFAVAHTMPTMLSHLFYAHLFEIDPTLGALFTGDMASQQFKFMATLEFLVQSFDQPAILEETAMRLGREHVGYRVLDAHYAPVGEALLWALAQVLGPAFTPDARGAWVDTYAYVAELMQRGASEA